MDKPRRYSQFTIDERKQIEKMYKTNSLSEMGRVLGKNVSSIKRELTRCETGNYTAKQAQLDMENKRKERYKYLQDNLPFKRSVEMKQIETCIRMQPTVDENTVVKITGIEEEIVKRYFDRIKKQVMTSV